MYSTETKRLFAGYRDQELLSGCVFKDQGNKLGEHPGALPSREKRSKSHTSMVQEVKVSVAKPDGLTLLPNTYTVESKNQRLQVDFKLPHTCTHTHTHTHTHTK